MTIPHASECAPWVAANTHGCPSNLLTCDVNAGAVLPGAPTGCTVSPTAGFCLIGGFCVGTGTIPPTNPCVICDPFASTTGFVPDPAQEGVQRIDSHGNCTFCHNGVDLPCPS